MHAHINVIIVNRIQRKYESGKREGFEMRKRREKRRKYWNKQRSKPKLGLGMNLVIFKKS